MRLHLQLTENTWSVTRKNIRLLIKQKPKIGSSWVLIQSWVDLSTAVIQGLQLAVCFPELSHPCCRCITQLLGSTGSNVGHFHTTPPPPDGLPQDPAGARTFMVSLSQPSRLLRLDLCTFTHTSNTNTIKGKGTSRPVQSTSRWQMGVEGLAQL